MKNLSPRAKKILSIMAQDEARKFGSAQILPEHVLLAVIKSGDGVGVFAIKKLGLNPEDFKRKLELFLSSDNNSPTLDEIPKSRRYRFLLDIADIESAALHNNYIGTEHLLLAAVREENSLTANFFAEAHFTIMDIRLMVMELQSDNKSSVNNPAIESLVDSVFRSLLNDDLGAGLFGVFDEKKSAKANQPLQDKSSSGSQKQSFLAEYSRDLTKIAAESKDDPVVGRDKEIHRVIQILSRRTKNNPVLTGEPGVGKTAIVEGLAQHIAAGKVPSDLVKKRILSLDLAAMVAGTKYRGEFEERMKKMMKELQENKDIILFIDELHTIIGAGGPEGTMDASNIMKPALSRGEIQIIGATTTKEYRKHIEKDLALERRFQVVKVEEPGDRETEEILEGIKSKYEAFHRVKYEEDVIPAIVKLSRRYIPEKVLPDKAIDILDEAGASKKIQEEERPSELTELERSIAELAEEKKNLVQNQDFENAAIVRDKVIDLRRRLDMYSELWKKNVFNNRKTVSVADVEKIISEMTGIPVEQLTSSETERIIHMESELHNTVIGQNNAVSIISGAIRRARAGISSPKHPVGSFIFLGPTGVGKTELAKILSEKLSLELHRFDMSEYQEKHTVSRLIGSPPGYVGFEEGGLLTDAVRKEPNSVVLLDEIEKAHSDIYNILLQVMDYATLTDNQGKKADFRNTILIMTSNAGARDINKQAIGFGEKSLNTGAIQDAVKTVFSPEFVNRLDGIIPFNQLSSKIIDKITRNEITKLSAQLLKKNVIIEATPACIKLISDKGYSPEFGARNISRTIEELLSTTLADEVLFGKLASGGKAVCGAKNGKITIKYEPYTVK